MSDLLTRAEYGAIAADLDLPRTPFVDGKFRAGTGADMETINPATGEVLATISTAGVADVDLAVRKAREAFEQGHWARAHPSDRKDVLIKLVKYMTRRRRELAVMESLEAGKPIFAVAGVRARPMALFKRLARLSDGQV
ncbi:MAG: aldehyde dehydrogenase family protein, partial [Pseudomonadota bacterium]